MIYRTMIWSRLITGTALASALATTAVAQDVWSTADLSWNWVPAKAT